MAALVLLPRAAEARIVATDLGVLGGHEPQHAVEQVLVGGLARPEQQRQRAGRVAALRAQGGQVVEGERLVGIEAEGPAEFGLGGGQVVGQVGAVAEQPVQGRPGIVWSLGDQRLQDRGQDLRLMRVAAHGHDAERLRGLRAGQAGEDGRQSGQVEFFLVRLLPPVAELVQIVDLHHQPGDGGDFLLGQIQFGGHFDQQVRFVLARLQRLGRPGHEIAIGHQIPVVQKFGHRRHRGREEVGVPGDEPIQEVGQVVGDHVVGARREQKRDVGGHRGAGQLHRADGTDADPVRTQFQADPVTGGERGQSAGRQPNAPVRFDVHGDRLAVEVSERRMSDRLEHGGEVEAVHC